MPTPLTRIDTPDTLQPMSPNRDNLHRTQDGYYLAGVRVRPDGQGGHLAHIYIAIKGPQGEVDTVHAMTMPRVPTFDVAAERAHAWASEHLPRIFELAPGDLRAELMEGAEFG